MDLIRKMTAYIGGQDHRGPKSGDGFDLAVIHIVRNERHVYQALGHIIVCFLRVIVVERKRPTRSFL